MGDELKREMFWMVWCPMGRAPAYRHNSLSSATTEAHRLARQSPGGEFYVLAPVGAYMIEQPKIVALDIDPEFIPF